MNQPVPPPPENPDQSIPWHFGEPLQEQRSLLRGEALVDLSNRAVLTVTGPDRLSWLNDLTTALLLDLEPMDSRLALILDPNGRVDHELHLVDDGTTTWIITAPGSGERLLAYLHSMQFMLRVEAHDVTDEFAVVGAIAAPPAQVLDSVGSLARAWWVAPPEFTGSGVTPSGRDRGGEASKYVPTRPGTFAAVEIVVRREDLAEVLRSRPGEAGAWAWEALRVAAGVPRAGVDTDNRSLPHEYGWIGPAVHLAKGCYRGQETVARTHNMGHPPRRLTLLHLDGSAQTLPQVGADVMLAGRRVGRVGSVAIHHELGPIALAVLKRRTDPAADLDAGGVAARQEVVVV